MPFLTFKNKIILFLVALITVLGVGLRLYAAPRLAIDVDERIYLQAANQYANFMRQADWHMLVWNDYNSEHPSFYKLIYGAALLTQPRIDAIDQNSFIDGKSIAKVIDRQWGLADRYVSVFFGGLTLLALSLVSPVAGLFYAFDTIAVQFNSTLFLESLPVLTSFLCALCYLRWYRGLHQASQPPKTGLIWLGFSAVFLGMTAASKYNYAVVAIAIIIHFVGSLILRKSRWKDVAPLAAWGMLALAFFLLFDTYLWAHTASRLLGSLNFHLAHPASERAIGANLPFYQPLLWFTQPTFKTATNAQYIFPIKLDTLIGILALIGLPRLLAREPFYFIWLVVSLVTLMIWPTKFLQYAMIAMIPLCLSAGIGALGLYAWGRERLFARIKAH